MFVRNIYRSYSSYYWVNNVLLKASCNLSTTSPNNCSICTNQIRKRVVEVQGQRNLSSSSSTSGDGDGDGDNDKSTNTGKDDKKEKKKNQKKAPSKEAGAGKSIKLDFKKLSKLGKTKTDKEVGIGAGADGREVQIPSDLLAAVKSVAADLGGDTKQTETELVQKLKDQNTGGKINLSDIMVGMKIDRTKKEESQQMMDPTTGGGGGRAQRVRRVLEEQSRYKKPGRDYQDRDRDRGRDREYDPDRRDRDNYNNRDRDRDFRPYKSNDRQQQLRALPGSGQYVKVNLFGARPLGIFSASHKLKSDQSLQQDLPKLKIWDALEAKELKLTVTHPPKNGFEEMILWTEQGKLWKFPIDNEQGLEEEAKSSFADHIFLEPMINSWCPQKGPIRHFMEIVCVGLGKNPHMTVKEKHEYLEWYHQYFLKKAKIIKDVGAGVIK